MASIFLANERIIDNNNNTKILNIYFVCIEYLFIECISSSRIIYMDKLILNLYIMFQNYKLVRQSIIGRIMEKKYIFCSINIG